MLKTLSHFLGIVTAADGSRDKSIIVGMQKIKKKTQNKVNFRFQGAMGITSKIAKVAVELEKVATKIDNT